MSGITFFWGVNTFLLKPPQWVDDPVVVSVGIIEIGGLALEIAFQFAATSSANSVFDFIAYLKDETANYPNVMAEVDTVRTEHGMKVILTIKKKKIE